MFAGIVLVIVVSLYRLLPVLTGMEMPQWLWNFSPMAALFLCVPACFPRRWAMALPFAVLLGTGFILNIYHSQQAMAAGHAPYPYFSVELFVQLIAFAGIAFFGWQLRRQPRMKVLLPAAAGSSIFFYLFTNTVSWLTDPGYVGIGWTSAVVYGLPPYSYTIPAWHFFRNAFAADLLFTFLFLASVRVSPRLAQDVKHPVAAAW